MLDATNVSDITVRFLAVFPQLRRLSLRRNPQVTEHAVQQLGAAVPLTHLRVTDGPPDAD